MAKNKKNNVDYCAFPHCRNNSDIIWLGVGVCDKHFKWVCEVSREKAYKKLNVPQAKIKANETPINGIKRWKGNS